MDVNIAEYPQLKLLCWNLPGVQTLPGHQALAIYENRWRHLDEAALTEKEQNLIDKLVDTYGQGRLCV